MKYEFHIGDYVETKDGVVGYIINVSIAESYINGYQVLTGRKLIDKINELVDIVNELRKESI